MRVVTIVGARPQFIKAAPVSRLLRQHHQEFLIHTGQHYDDAMSDLFFRQLGIPAPDVNLEIGSGTHAVQTGAMLPGIESAVVAQKPDCVMVYGDTNSTLAGALVGAKLHVPVVHVEAGLRSYDRRMPEEVNRVVADHLSTLLLCPTETAVRNLAKEGLTKGVAVTGDVMLDAFLQHAKIARESAETVSSLGLSKGGYALVTVHRAENVDDPAVLARVIRGVNESRRRAVFPVHPRTRKALATADIQPAENVRLIDPVGYLEMLVLEEGAGVIVTDSGGVQKEAYFAGRPCVTLRETTEWTETVAAGWNVLVGSNPEEIARAIREFRPDGARPNLFGDGHASERVVEALSGVESTNP